MHPRLTWNSLYEDDLKHLILESAGIEGMIFYARLAFDSNKDTYCPQTREMSSKKEKTLTPGAVTFPGEPPETARVDARTW